MDPPLVERKRRLTLVDSMSGAHSRRAELGVRR
jgi:hypothetical protein